MFIVFEGGEGSGKSTQVALLHERLQRAGFAAISTREPGGTVVAEQLRSLILAPPGPMSGEVEAYLFAAARLDHVQQLVLPALAAGTIVVSDRFVDSSIAYQGHARGLGVDFIASLNQHSVAMATPDITFILDIEPAIGLARATDANRMEREQSAFHQQVRQGLLDCALRAPERYLILDGASEPTQIAEQIWMAVRSRLQQQSSAVATN